VDFSSSERGLDLSRAEFVWCSRLSR